MTYVYKSMECELCHRNLPDFFIAKGQQIPLVDLPNPVVDYLVLEDLGRACGNKERKYYVIPYMENNTLRMGRASECEISTEDISVSRIHAFIRMQDEEFYLEDNASKFGTSVLLKGELMITPEFNSSVQIGKTLVSFELKMGKKSETKEFVAAANESNEMEDNFETDKIEFMLRNKRQNTSKSHIIFPN